ncbi:unnamed protein product [Parascedosporium putredinis]|uniref:Uncharacterized protein n=1 Tax=Parascedosporium putredinis TaxID=1442378 RepID=A0A9P1HB86_9PEZI|nr:unnamed protein product [Parascedosporium putredinis]CAI8002036.1 unnamed protein product [Parascedosporium putredinis]
MRGRDCDSSEHGSPSYPEAAEGTGNVSGLENPPMSLQVLGLTKSIGDGDKSINDVYLEGAAVSPEFPC